MTCVQCTVHGTYCTAVHLPEPRRSVGPHPPVTGAGVPTVLSTSNVMNPLWQNKGEKGRGPLCYRINFSASSQPPVSWTHVPQATHWQNKGREPLCYKINFVASSQLQVSWTHVLSTSNVMNPLWQNKGEKDSGPILSRHFSFFTVL